MSLEKLMLFTSRAFFLGAFLLLALAVIEKIANATGYTILRLAHGGTRLLEYTVVLLAFVIALQLSEMVQELKSRKP